jgi:hypothetical protein
VTGEQVVLHVHGGAYHLGSPAWRPGLIALLSAAAQGRVLSARQQENELIVSALEHYCRGLARTHCQTCCSEGA